MTNDLDIPGFPAPGDRLFVQADIRDDAVSEITSDPRERFYRLPLGYKRAGDILIDQAATDFVDGRNVVYAALFCYRHAVELYLKQCIEASGAQSKGHVLEALWEQFYAVVMDNQSVEPGGLRETGALVAELADADRRSDGFRYPTDVRRTPFSFCGAIDLANVKVVMKRMECFFECACAEIDYRRDRM